jgi:hypothetical protein
VKWVSARGSPSITSIAILGLCVGAGIGVALGIMFTHRAKRKHTKCEARAAVAVNGKVTIDQCLSNKRSVVFSCPSSRQFGRVPGGGYKAPERGTVTFCAFFPIADGGVGLFARLRRPAPNAPPNRLRKGEAGGRVSAELIHQKHTCGPDCFCWQLRQVPSISDAIRKLHVQKLQVPTQPRD